MKKKTIHSEKHGKLSKTELSEMEEVTKPRPKNINVKKSSINFR